LPELLVRDATDPHAVVHITGLDEAEYGAVRALVEGVVAGF
jgi:hypothetical protein